jgi:hypothetical protein
MYIVCRLYLSDTVTLDYLVIYPSADGRSSTLASLLCEHTLLSTATSHSQQRLCPSYLHAWCWPTSAACTRLSRGVWARTVECTLRSAFLTARTQSCKSFQQILLRAPRVRFAVASQTIEERAALVKRFVIPGWFWDDHW